MPILIPVCGFWYRTYCWFLCVKDLELTGICWRRRSRSSSQKAKRGSADDPVCQQFGDFDPENLCRFHRTNPCPRCKRHDRSSSRRGKRHISSPFQPVPNPSLSSGSSETSAPSPRETNTRPAAHFIAFQDCSESPTTDSAPVDVLAPSQRSAIQIRDLFSPPNSRKLLTANGHPHHRIIPSRLQLSPIQNS